MPEIVGQHQINSMIFLQSFCLILLCLCNFSTSLLLISYSFQLCVLYGMCVCMHLCVCMHACACLCVCIFL